MDLLPTELVHKILLKYSALKRLQTNARDGWRSIVDGGRLCDQRYLPRPAQRLEDLYIRPFLRIKGSYSLALWFYPPDRATSEQAMSIRFCAALFHGEIAALDAMRPFISEELCTHNSLCFGEDNGLHLSTHADGVAAAGGHVESVSWLRLNS